MNREWLSDAFQQIPDSEIERIHNYLDNKGKNVIRGPTTIAGPDGTLVNVSKYWTDHDQPRYNLTSFSHV